MNGTVFVALGLLAIVALVIVKMVKDRKQGRASCGCGCSHCTGACRRKE